MIPIRSAFVLIALVSAGCRNTTDVCPAVVRPGIVVEIRDARTGLPIAQGAQGFVREGTYVDSLRPYQGVSANPATLISLQAALGRPGKYDVEVQRAGYLRWTKAGVTVSSGQCGPRTVILHADLVPASS